jgi:antitoxin (DNA-binding transcriptional repressor) of toxin-antitoxin stability system
MLVLDEAWSVFGVNDDYLTAIVKTSRKYNLSFCIITQDAGDLLRLNEGRPRGEPILNNTYFKFLLRADSASIQDVVKYLNEGNEIVVMKRKIPIARLTPVQKNSAEIILLEIGRVLAEVGVSKKEALKALDRARREIYG